MDLRNKGIRDQAVLEAIERTPRELFVPKMFADRAWDDQSLPIANGQTISQPYIVALMTQLLGLNSRSKVLEIGTGSGYQAAILSRLCRRVYTIERFRSLLQEAEERFRQLKLRNITAMVGDGYKGWPLQAPFKHIIATAAAPEVPPALIEQLDEGGVLVIPVDVARNEQIIQKITRTADGLKTENMLPVRFVPMVKGVAREN